MFPLRQACISHMVGSPPWAYAGIFKQHYEGSSLAFFVAPFSAREFLAHLVVLPPCLALSLDNAYTVEALSTEAHPEHFSLEPLAALLAWCKPSVV
jgi:hypothetical protein